MQPVQSYWKIPALYHSIKKTKQVKKKPSLFHPGLGIIHFGIPSYLMIPNSSRRVGKCGDCGVLWMLSIWLVPYFSRAEKELCLGCLPASFIIQDMLITSIFKISSQLKNNKTNSMLNKHSSHGGHDAQTCPASPEFAGVTIMCLPNWPYCSPFKSNC